MKIRTRLLVVATAMAFFAALRPGHSEVRTVTETDATSGCIGNPITATCAVETLIACFARGRRDLCQSVGVGAVEPSAMRSARTAHYVVVDVLALRSGDRLCRSGNPDGKCIIGEAGLVQVDTLQEFGGGSENGEIRPWRPVGYLLRKVDGRWQVLEWAAGEPGRGAYRHSRGYRGDFDMISVANATSDCIGDPVTPVCAVETFAACGIRAEQQLCQRVGIQDMRGWPGESGVSVAYFIGRVQEFAPGDIYCSDLNPSDDCRISEPGFAAVHISFQQCRAGDVTCAEGPFTDERCLVKDGDGRWQVIGCEEDYSTTLP